MLLIGKDSFLSTIGKYGKLLCYRFNPSHRTNQRKKFRGGRGNCPRNFAKLSSYGKMPPINFSLGSVSSTTNNGTRGPLSPKVQIFLARSY